MWRGEFGKTPPFDIGPDALFVAYSAWAEMTCFIVLGWKFPEHIFDLHTAYLAASNILLPYNPDEVRKRQRKGLSDACRAYGIEGWERIDKETIASDIGEGRWRKYGREAVFDYCEEDVRKSTLLLRQATARPRSICRAADVERVLHWSNYSAKAVAQIQARGMPIDMPLWNLVQENKTAVIGELLRRFDPSHGSEDPIYTPEGEWSYARFERWLVEHRRRRMAAPREWPARHRRRRLPPDVPRARASRDCTRCATASASSCGRKLPIGRDGRNRPKPVSVLHRDRPQRAREKPLQRARRHALVHGVPARHDRRLSRLAHARGRYCRRPLR